MSHPKVTITEHSDHFSLERSQQLVLDDEPCSTKVIPSVHNVVRSFSNQERTIPGRITLPSCTWTSQPELEWKRSSVQGRINNLDVAREASVAQSDRQLLFSSHVPRFAHQQEARKLPPGVPDPEGRDGGLANPELKQRALMLRQQAIN